MIVEANPDIGAHRTLRDDLAQGILLCKGDPKSELVPLWKGVKFELVRTLDLRGLRGEAYKLTNTSDKQVVMDEREFYRDGVQAVSVEKLVLEAGDSTAVFVLSEGE